MRWASLSPEIPAPAERHPEGDTVWLFIAEIVGNPPDYRYRLSGSRLDEQFGVCLTGKRLSELPVEKACLDAIHRQYAETVTELRPILCRHAYKVDGARDIAYRRLAVPASTDGNRANL